MRRPPLHSAMTPNSRTIWKRRVLLMAVVAVVVGVPVTIVVRAGDDDAGAPDAAAIDLPSLERTKYDRHLGVELRLPRGWHGKREQGVLGLRSADAGTRIAISAPGPAADADELYDETLAELRGSYEGFKLLKELNHSMLGGLRARVATIGAVPQGGGETRLLVATASGEHRAYLVVVSTSGSESGKSLVEAQALLNELKLVG